MEIKRGIFPFGGGTARWVQTTGWGNAMRYLLTGDEFGADEAYRLGIVQEIVAPVFLLGRAVALAERIAEQSPLGVYATLQSARTAVREGERAAAARLIPEIQRLSQTRDAEEGFMSILERRPPLFEGR
ncbi:MAG: hypothetical protein H7338_01165 [Candidatus Sericytochromatia bacterium]|nr:hypothetical protein [Candidatus Sericytochromatia bacterium]